MSETQEEAPARRNARRPFGTEEDAVIMRLMLMDPIHGWEGIARRLPGRTARQCRERWTNYLSPSLRSDPWVDAEDRLLVEKVNELKFAWSSIARYFNGRSHNDIKNRWYSHLKYETVKDGDRFLFTGNGERSPYPERKKRNRSKASPKQNALRLLEQQRAVATPKPIVTKPKWLSTDEATSNETEDIWDGMILDEGPDEGVAFGPF
jgi:hypothetical protein